MHNLQYYHEENLDCVQRIFPFSLIKFNHQHPFVLIFINSVDIKHPGTQVRGKTFTRTLYIG